MTGPLAARLEPGGRLHLQHGPIDLVCELVGPAGEREAGFCQAKLRFETILDELVGELAILRRPVGPARPLLRGPVARRMARAVWPHRAAFVTPMAAVAGAVADEVLAAMTAGRRCDKAFVNNGGDIAFALAPGAAFIAGLVADQAAPRLDGRMRIGADRPGRGIATSGWRGRSHSLGIADAVTVLADDAAAADAAATLIANAVDLDSPAIRRRPARELDPDSDLGARPVTVAVGALSIGEIAAALSAGAAVAENMRATGLIVAAGLVLGDRAEIVAPAPAIAQPGVRTA